MIVGILGIQLPTLLALLFSSGAPKTSVHSPHHKLLLILSSDLDYKGISAPVDALPTSPMASIFSGLRRAAPRISKDFFICHRCAKQTRPAMGPLRMPIRANTARTIRFNSSAAAFSKDARANTSPLAALSQSIGKEGRKAVDKTLKEPFFPKQTSNTVAYFLIGSAASVFGLVVFGGLTRLTESG